MSTTNGGFLNASTERLLIVTAIVFAVLFVLATMISNRGVSAEELARLTEEQRRGMECILLELGHHRQNAYEADRDQAAAAGRPFNVPAPPPTDPIVNPAVCAGYFEARTTPSRSTVLD